MKTLDQMQELDTPLTSQHVAAAERFCQWLACKVLDQDHASEDEVEQVTHKVRLACDILLYDRKLLGGEF